MPLRAEIRQEVEKEKKSDWTMMALYITATFIMFFIALGALALRMGETIFFAVVALAGWCSVLALFYFISCTSNRQALKIFDYIDVAQKEDLEERGIHAARRLVRFFRRDKQNRRSCRKKRPNRY